MDFNDVVEAGLKLKQQAKQFEKDLFSCFEGADYERGDSIFLSRYIADKIDMAVFPKGRRFKVSPLLPKGAYLIAKGSYGGITYDEDESIKYLSIK